MKTKKLFLTTSLLLINCYLLIAQDGLGEGLDNVTAGLTSNFSKLKNLLYIISGFIAVFGIIKIFGKYQNQDQDTSKAVANWVMAFVFFFGAGLLIDATFIDN